METIVVSLIDRMMKTSDIIKELTSVITDEKLATLYVLATRCDCLAGKIGLANHLKNGGSFTLTGFTPSESNVFRYELLNPSGKEFDDSNPTHYVREEMYRLLNAATEDGDVEAAMKFCEMYKANPYAMQDSACGGYA